MNGKNALMLTLAAGLAASVWLIGQEAGRSGKVASAEAELRAQRAEAELAKLRGDLQAARERLAERPSAAGEPDEVYFATPPAPPITGDMPESSSSGTATGGEIEAAPAEHGIAKREADFRAEPVDPAWANAMEQHLNQVYDELALEGSQLSMASCRSTLCRIQIDHRDAASEARLIGRLGKGAELIQGLGQASIERLLDPSGAVRTIVYLPRGAEG